MGMEEFNLLHGAMGIEDIWRYHALERCGLSMFIPLFLGFQHVSTIRLWWRRISQPSFRENADAMSAKWGFFHHLWWHATRYGEMNHQIGDTIKYYIYTPCIYIYTHQHHIQYKISIYIYILYMEIRPTKRAGKAGLSLKKHSRHLGHDDFRGSPIGRGSECCL
jgi:hypothetical protein